MALGNAIKGARHTPIQITWKDSNGNAFDLSAAGATLSGNVINADDGSVVRVIDGTLAFVTDGSDGKFNWTYGATDVGEESLLYVQFKCTYTDLSYDLTKITEWDVLGIVEEL